MGGITSGGEALEFLAAGASVVAVGTESFRDPGAGERVRSELAEELAARRIASLTEVVGASAAADRQARNEVQTGASSEPSKG